MAILSITYLNLRGGTLHNHLARQVGDIFAGYGFQVNFEHPVKLANGDADYIDIFVERGDCQIAIEIETTARHAIDNAIKADLACLPLWIIVPNHKVKSSLTKKLITANIKPAGLRINLLLLGTLKQTLTIYLPLITTANNNSNKQIIK